VQFTDSPLTRRATTATPSWGQRLTGDVFGSPRDPRTADYGAGRLG
jgi:hypothetical protein